MKNLPTLAALFAIGMLQLAPVGRAEMRLVGSAGGQVWTGAVGREGEIVSASASGGGVLPHNVAWKIEGDLRQNAQFVLTFPTYYICETPPRGGLPGQTFAIIFDNPWQWKPAIGVNDLVVCAWMVDGQVQLVVPLPAGLKDGSRGYCHCVELSPELAKGAPVMLVWSKGRFVPSIPQFSNAAEQRAVDLLLTGSREEIGAAIDGLKSPKIASRTGVPLLHLAAGAGLDSVVERLLARGANPRSEDGNSWQAIDWASRNERTSVVRLLLSRGRDKFAPSEVNLSRSLRWGHVDTAAEIWRAAPKLPVDDLVTQAASLGRAAVLEDIAAQKGSVAFKALKPTTVTDVIVHRDLATIRVFLSHGLPPDGKLGGVPYVCAAAGVDDELLAAFLEAGARATTTTDQGVTPLMMAAKRGSARSVKLLLDAKADLTGRDDHGWTALHFAVAAGQLEVATLLMQRGAKVDLRDAKGYAPLELALEARSKSIAERVIEAGARLDVRKPEIKTNLVHAISMDLVEVVRRAVEDGWNPAEKLVENFSAEDVAELTDARMTTAYLAKQSGRPPSQPILPADAPDQTPRAIKIGLGDPGDSEDPRPTQKIQVAGLVDVNGRLLLPRLAGCEHPATCCAILDAIPRWLMQPAQKGGHAVPSMYRLGIEIAGTDGQVYARDQVDTPPVALTVFKIDGRYARIPDAGVGAELSAMNSSLRPMAPDWAAYSCIIEIDGSVSYVTLIAPNNGSLEFLQDAMRALRAARFKPGLRSGVPVRTRTIVELRSST